ncbi:MAG: JAB domain-containing protein [Ruminococcus sp.]|nr:JAB domain-containing protein [Ruminococcus sp.]
MANNAKVKRSSRPPSDTEIKFDREGIEGLTGEESAEFLLEFTSVKNKKETARRLTEKFGSIEGIFKEDISRLREEGLTDMRSAAFMKLIPEIVTVYGREKNAGRQCLGVKQLMRVFRHCFMGAGEEIMVLACFDSKLKLISLTHISRGELADAELGARQILGTVTAKKCHMAALAHNHPCGRAVPSEEDISSTRILARTMGYMGVYLMDHIIIAEDGFYSMRTGGELDIFD